MNRAGIILLMEVAGVVFVSLGAGMVFAPAGIITAGVFLLLFAFAIERSSA